MLAYERDEKKRWAGGRNDKLASGRQHQWARLPDKPAAI